MSVRRERDRKGRQRWRIDTTYVHPDGKRERVTKVAQVQTRRGAEDEERKILAALASGTWKTRAKGVPTLGVFQEEFFRNHVSQRKASTQKSKADLWRLHVGPFFGGMRLNEITARDLSGFVAGKTKEGHAVSYVNNMLALLSNMLLVAVEWKIIRRDDVPTIRKLKTPPDRFDFLTFDEARALTAAAPEGRWRAMVAVGLFTGMRIGELRALPWAAVDFHTERVHIRQADYHGRLGPPKNNRPRTLRLAPTALAALRSLEPEDEWVFGPGMPKRTTSSRRLAEACDAAGLRRVGWHVLRHTFASHLAMRGVQLLAIQELMGHANIRETQRYSHLVPDLVNQAVMTLEGPPPALAAG